MPRLKRQAALCFLCAAFTMLAALAGMSRAAADEPYVLGVGDRLRITVFSRPMLSGEYRVRDDGRVSIPFLGEVSAAGRDLSGLEAALRERLGEREVAQPVSAEVVEYRPFFVLGDVRNGGSYPYVVGMTVLHAVSLAGGFRVNDADETSLTIELIRLRENLDVLQWDHWAEQARQARLIAAATGAGSIAFPPALIERRGHPQIATLIDGEEKILAGQLVALKNELELLNKQIGQISEERVALEAQAQSKETQAGLIDLELRDTDQLFRQGLTRRQAVTALRRQQAEFEGDRREIAAFISRAAQSISGVELQITNRRDDFVNDALRDLQKSRERMLELDIRVAAAQEAVEQAETRLSRQRASQGTGAKAYQITRRDPGGLPRTVDATEATAVKAGDIVRVFGVDRPLAGRNAPPAVPQPRP